MQPADPASFPSGSKERCTQSNRTRPPDTDWPATRRPICPSSVPPLQRHGFLLVKTLSVIPNRLSVLRKSSCCVALPSSPCAKTSPATTIGNRILLLIVASCARLWAEARSGWRRSIPREQCTLAAWRAVSRTRTAADDERHRRQQGGKASITCRMAAAVRGCYPAGSDRPSHVGASTERRREPVRRPRDGARRAATRSRRRACRARALRRARRRGRDREDADGRGVPCARRALRRRRPMGPVSGAPCAACVLAVDPGVRPLGGAG